MKRLFLCSLLWSSFTLYSSQDSPLILEDIHLHQGMPIEKILQTTRAVSLSMKTETIELYRERIWALLQTYTDTLYIDAKSACALTRLPLDRALPFLKNFCPEVKLSDSRICEN